jgi:hypothetical protein
MEEKKCCICDANYSIYTHLIKFESSLSETCSLGQKNFKKEISLLAQRARKKTSWSSIFCVMLIFSSLYIVRQNLNPYTFFSIKSIY